jgi:hypothetical protein
MDSVFNLQVDACPVVPDVDKLSRVQVIVLGRDIGHKLHVPKSKARVCPVLGEYWIELQIKRIYQG